MAKKQHKHFTIFDCIYTATSKHKFRGQVADFEDFAAEGKTHKEAREKLVGLIFDNLKDYTDDQWMAQSYDYGVGQERFWCWSLSNDQVYCSEYFH